MFISCSGPVPVRGYTPLFFKLSDRVIDSKKDLVNVSLSSEKSCTFNISWFPKSATTQKQLEVKISRRCWTSTCLQRAARRRPTLRSRFFKTALHFIINWFTRFPWPKTSRCTLSRSTRRASRSHSPTPRTTRCSLSSSRTIITLTIFVKVELRTDAGGWVPLHLLHLARQTVLP